MALSWCLSMGIHVLQMWFIFNIGDSAKHETREQPKKQVLISIKIMHLQTQSVSMCIRIVLETEKTAWLLTKRRN